METALVIPDVPGQVILAMNAGNYEPDPAAVFAIAVSLWRACGEAEKTAVCLSDEYAGMDGLMREVMRVGTIFEDWACRHVDFAELGDVWPYLLEDRFGKECLAVAGAGELATFHENDCLRMALRLGLPIREG